MEVEVFDEELGRTIEKIIDPSGKERFKSIYSSIYTWHDPYEVIIRDKDGTRHGLIDKEGNEILPASMMSLGMASTMNSREFAS